jgi:hypothetical protein
MKLREALSARKVYAFLLAMYLFNYSIDSRDAHLDHIGEDLSYNDVESIVEFTLEYVLGIENAMKEHDEQDDDNGSIFGHSVYIVNTAMSELLNYSDFGAEVVHHYSNPSQSLSQASPEINSPPPRA